MDIQMIAQLVSTLGFPICVCGTCFWYINKMQEQHRDEINKVTEAVNNNTLVLQKLIDKIGE